MKNIIERFKYLLFNIDIPGFPEYYWNGKLLVFTFHFKRELEKLGKFEEFALKVLENGEHRLVSKRQNKYNALYRHKNKFICVSYAKSNKAVILIHIKPTGRKLAGRRI